MHIDDLLAIKEQLFKTCCQLSVGKSNDYADHKDVLMNFRRGAAMFGMSVISVIKTRLADKLSRLHQLSTGKQQLVAEKIEDTVADAHNYLDLLYVALLEEHDPKNLQGAYASDDFASRPTSAPHSPA